MSQGTSPFKRKHEYGSRKAIVNISPSFINKCKGHKHGHHIDLIMQGALRCFRVEIIWFVPLRKKYRLNIRYLTTNLL